MKDRRLRSLPTWLLPLALLAGCASGPEDLRPVAEDPVCLYNRDLGCVRVRVEETTPRATYRGKTYYFCRDTCRQAFLKDPGHYLPQDKGS